MKLPLSISWFKKPIGIALILCIIIATSIGITAFARDDVFGKIKIGALLPLTGNFATYGENEKAAITLAVEEVNDLLRETRNSWTLSVLFRDTQVNPDIALENLMELTEKGVNFIIGPLTSGEVWNIKEYADANEILVVSHGSTAPELAIADDFIYRFALQDRSGQGPAIARMMYDDGKRFVISVVREDMWGLGLEEAVADRFTELGGTVLGGIRYDPEDPPFPAVVLALQTAVADAVSSYEAAQVGVLYIGFDEVIEFFTEANEAIKYPDLTKVKWYGSDGTCLNSDMVEEPTVAEFSAVTEFTNTIHAPTKSERYQKVYTRLMAELGRKPDLYAYIAYDIVWAYALSLLSTNSYDVETVKEVLPEVTESMFGASGWIVLDDAGDRVTGDYNLWIVAEYDGAYKWKMAGTYVQTSDSISWFP